MLTFTGVATVVQPQPTLPCVPERSLAGRRFGALLVEWGPVHNGSRAAWWCHCDCGTHKLIRDDALRGARSRSCGCAQRHHIAAIGRARATHGGTGTRLYSIWHGMIQRCEYVGHKGFPSCGARGIRVCTEWRADFAAFRAWAEARGYAPDLTLDRMDADGHYEPGNCRWASYAEQNINRRHFGLRATKRRASQ